LKLNSENFHFCDIFLVAHEQRVCLCRINFETRAHSRYGVLIGFPRLYSKVRKKHEMRLLEILILEKVSAFIEKTCPLENDQCRNECVAELEGISFSFFKIEKVVFRTIEAEK
jgi:hypothetical protein